MRRPLPSRRALVAIDVMLAIALVAVSNYALTQPWDDGFRVGAGAIDVVAVTAMVLPFALRTLAPAWGLALVVAGQLAVGAIGTHSLLFYSGFVPMAVLVYAVARHDDGWPGRLTLLCVPLLLLSDARVPAARSLANLAFSTIVLGAAWTGGRLVRRLARQAQALEVALSRLGLERDTGERAAAEVERARIAAEMHDVVGHALSLMVLQTGAARAELQAASGDSAAEARLRAAESAGRTALEELRRTLGVLRRTNRVPPRVEADTSPH